MIGLKTQNIIQFLPNEKQEDYKTTLVAVCKTFLCLKIS